MTSLPDSLGERALLLPKHNQPQSSDELEVAERRLPPRAGYRGLWKQIRDALLDSETPTDVESAGWVEWGRQQIESDAMVTPLMIITFSCALADAITLQRYSTFATSMTGNTVLLAVRMMGTTDKSPLPAGVSLAGFVVSGLVFGQVGCRIGHFRRDWLLFNFTSQVVVLLANVALVAPGVSKRFRPEGDLGWVYLLLLAIQGGIQVTQAANSGAREIPSAMMTTPYAALISDATLFSSGRRADVRSRNRRLAYIVVFWSGAFVGAALSFRTNIFIGTIAVLICKIAALVYLASVKGLSPKVPNQPRGAVSNGDTHEANGQRVT